MPNPKAPRVFKEANERQDPLEAFTMRLRRLGASDDQVQAVRDGWDEYDEDWTPERRAELVAMTDQRLRAMIAQADDEYEAGTSADPDGDAEREADAYADARADADERVGGSVPNLLTWVGGDPMRARALLDAERATATAEGRDPRSTLVGPLEGMG